MKRRARTLHRRYGRAHARGFVVRLRALPGGAAFYVACRKSLLSGETFCEDSTPHAKKAYVFSSPEAAGAEVDAWRAEGWDVEIARAA